jgi:acetolactate synthase-1/3 small subunit
MEDKIQKFTVSVYSEDKPGVLYRLSNLFLKRKININSLTVSDSEINNFAKFIITIDTTEAKVHLICKQIEKIIEVSEAKYYSDNEIFFIDNAILKVSYSKENKDRFLSILKKFDIEIESEKATKDEYTSIISINNSENVIDELRKELSIFNLVEFVRSGRIAIKK